MHVALITLIILLILMGIEVVIISWHMLVIWKKVIGNERGRYIDHALERFKINDAFYRQIGVEDSRFQSIANSHKTISGFCALYCPKELVFMGLSISIFLIFTLLMVVALYEDDLDEFNDTISHNYLSRFILKIIGFFSIGFIGVFPTVFIENREICGKVVNDTISSVIHIIVMISYIILPSVADIWQSIDAKNNIWIWDLLSIIYFMVWLSINLFKNCKIRVVDTREKLNQYLESFHVYLILNFFSELLLIYCVTGCYIYRLLYGLTEVL
jgi:hypothetical protein